MRKHPNIDTLSRQFTHRLKCIPSHYVGVVELSAFKLDPWRQIVN